MTAGNAATASDAVVLHRTNTSLPYQPRALKRGERNNRELFVFFSPRNQRIVTISDAINAALALKFEFDPSLECYVERPRRLQYSPKQQIDVSFWTRSKAGEEKFHLVIPECGTIGSTSGTISIRDRQKLDEAAARNSIALQYPTERELLSARTWLATAFELLPWVWWYGRLLSRSLIRRQILGHLTQAERASLTGLTQAIGYPAAHVRAVVAGMIHDGSLRLIDYVPGAIDAVVEVPRA